MIVHLVAVTNGVLQSAGVCVFNDVFGFYRINGDKRRRGWCKSKRWSPVLKNYHGIYLLQLNKFTKPSIDLANIRTEMWTPSVFDNN